MYHRKVWSITSGCSPNTLLAWWNFFWSGKRNSIMDKYPWELGNIWAHTESTGLVPVGTVSTVLLPLRRLLLNWCLLLFSSKILFDFYNDHNLKKAEVKNQIHIFPNSLNLATWWYYYWSLMDSLAATDQPSPGHQKYDINMAEVVCFNVGGNQYNLPHCFLKCTPKLCWDRLLLSNGRQVQ